MIKFWNKWNDEILVMVYALVVLISIYQHEKNGFLFFLLLLAQVRILFLKDQIK